MKKVIPTGRILINNKKVFYLCLFTLLTVLTLFNFAVSVFPKPKVVYSYSDPFQKKIVFWQNFLESHPTYFDGWIELSSLHLEKGNLEAARFAYSKAWKINPNSEVLKTLSSSLE